MYTKWRSAIYKMTDKSSISRYKNTVEIMEILQINRHYKRRTFPFIASSLSAEGTEDSRWCGTHKTTNTKTECWHEKEPKLPSTQQISTCNSFLIRNHSIVLHVTCKSAQVNKFVIHNNAVAISNLWLTDRKYGTIWNIYTRLRQSRVGLFWAFALYLTDKTRCIHRQ